MAAYIKLTLNGCVHSCRINIYVYVQFSICTLYKYSMWYVNDTYMGALNTLNVQNNRTGDKNATGRKHHHPAKLNSISDSNIYCSE